MEIESRPRVSGWSKKTSISGYTGSGYYEWTGSNNFRDPGNGVIRYTFKIDNPGVYEFRWRSRIAKGNDSTEHNDNWLKFNSGSNASGEHRLNGWTKVYQNQKGKWSWQSSTVDFDPQAIRRQFSKGTHSLEISGRSNGHAIDRIVLFHTGMESFSNSKFNNFSESNRTN